MDLSISILQKGPVSGCVFLALGVVLMLAAVVVMLSGEATAAAITAVLKTNFGRTKVGVDVGQVIIAAILSFVLLGRLEGIHIGTLVSAVLVGFLVNCCTKIIAPLQRWLNPDC